ncbi:MAG: baseplate J/gp47 family protein [Rhodobacteraceae bacterium]|nr:baseplate J/gp47 family protein [Paracoccaceae bacterium]
MSVRFDQIDLSRLPPPDVIEPLDYEVLLAEMVAQVTAADPSLAPVLALESEPAVKVLQAVAYVRLLDRARVNDAARAVMLAQATGADLDNLAALFGVARAVIAPADDSALPPVAAVLESDTRLRARAQLSLQAFSCGGPAGAYAFWAMTATPAVLDAMVDSPAPGDVRVVVLRDPASSLTEDEMITAVRDMVTRDDIRVLCDNVYVQPASPVPFTVVAALELLDGPDAGAVLDTARAAVAAFVAARFRIGASVTRAGLIAALYSAGVRDVVLTQPVENVEAAAHQVPVCTAITVAEAA